MTALDTEIGPLLVDASFMRAFMAHHACMQGAGSAGAIPIHLVSSGRGTSESIMQRRAPQTFGSTSRRACSCRRVSGQRVLWRQATRDASACASRRVLGAAGGAVFERTSPHIVVLECPSHMCFSTFYFTTHMKSCGDTQCAFSSRKRDTLVPPVPMLFTVQYFDGWRMHGSDRIVI